MCSVRRLLWAVVIAVATIAVVLVGMGEYFLSYALCHDTSAYNVAVEFEKFKRDYPWTAAWTDSIRADSTALRDTFVVDDEGRRMHAWFVASPDSTGNTAVIVHGYTSNSVDMMQIAYMYHHDFGWNVLLPDLIAHGMSEGETIQMGWKDRLAVEQWIGVAHEIFTADTMVVHGISMGAATTMCVSGDETPHYVRGFVEDCGYTSVWDEFSSELDKQFGLPAFPLMHITSMLCNLHNGWSFTEASPLNQVRKCTKPMLFIHGDADTYVPTWMVYPLYEAKAQPKRLWIAPGSAHAVAYQDHREEYTRQVKDFLNDCVLGR